MCRVQPRKRRTLWTYCALFPCLKPTAVSPTSPPLPLLLSLLFLSLSRSITMPFAMLLSSPSGLASSAFKGIHVGPLFLVSRWDERSKMVHEWEPRKRRYFEWRCRCDSRELSAVVNDLNNSDGSAIHRKAHNGFHVLAAYKHANTLGPEDDHSDGLWTKVLKKLDAFCRYIRPLGVLSVAATATSVAFLPVERMADLSPLFFVGLLKTLLPVIFMCIYTNGINEVFDVEIDKVNKPSLPLASGALSMEEGMLIAIAFCTMSIFMGVKSGSPPLLHALLALFFLGSAYSINLPLLRWKGNPFLTTLFAIGNYGIVPHLPFFVHFQKYILGRPVVLSKSILFATAFMCLFGAIICVLKDIPDIEGDKCAGIQNLVVRLGPERVFWLGTKALLVGYGIAMLVGAASTNAYSSFITVLGHGLLASILWFRAQSVDIHDKISTQSFCLLIWKLKTAEYLLLPFVR